MNETSKRGVLFYSVTPVALAAAAVTQVCSPNPQRRLLAFSGGANSFVAPAALSAADMALAFRVANSGGSIFPHVWTHAVEGCIVEQAWFGLVTGGGTILVVEGILQRV